ncbi:MAG: metallophosphoesterase family protein [Candidatus Omnitrophica bacterium]|nr:metallophosphoesterase family protein [Candidatus Omnitrophota bacterium]
MLLAIFSDIHANLEALETAVSYTERHEIKKWVVLGDTLGYGADPNLCFEWVLQHASIIVTGNHERAIVDPGVRQWFNHDAREAILWTENIIDPAFKKAILDFPYMKIEGDMVFTHGSPAEPEAFQYLMSYADCVPSFKQMKCPICFVGHTHIPSCFSEQKQEGYYLKPGLFQLEKNERVILNPGSIGQPRDRDPRLSFGIFDDEHKTFEIVRLSYDNEKAADKIRKAGLPAFLADRLL